MIVRRIITPFAMALSGLLVIGGCQSLHLPEATIQRDFTWLTEGGSAERTYHRAGEIRPPLERAWSYNAGGGFGPGSPLIVGTAVLVGTRKGEVHAIDIATGKSRGMVGMGESIDGTPVIDRFGIMYVPVSWGRRGLYAYDLTRGTTLWRQKRVPVEAGLLLVDDVLIAADVESNVVAYDARRGDVLWDITLSDRGMVHAAPLQIGAHMIAVADDHGYVTALDVRTGEVAWSASLDQPVYRSPARWEGTLLVPTTRGGLVALDAFTGAKVYAVDLSHSEVRLTTPAVAHGMAYIGSSEGTVFAVDANDGTIQWTYEGSEPLGGPPLIVGEVVYTADMAKHLRALDRSSGQLLWETEVSGRVKSAMAADDGGIIILAEPRNVLYYRPEAGHAASR